MIDNIIALLAFVCACFAATLGVIVLSALSVICFAMCVLLLPVSLWETWRT